MTIGSGGRHAALRLLLWAGVAAVGPSPVEAQTRPCLYRGAPDALAERPSPLDSVFVPLGDATGKLCYGRPSARGRTVVGGLDPFGAPWRLGANEPTTLHFPVPVSVGGVDVPPGAYSLYAIPGASSWTIVVNASTNRWGIPISTEVRAADVGSFTVTPTRLPEHVETLEFTYEPEGDGGGSLVYRWEWTTLRIPIVRR